MNQEERRGYVNYRIGSAYKTYEAAKVLFDNGFYNSAVNRLYYSAFYAINALLVNQEIDAQTHAGVKNQFSLHFIKTKKMDAKFGWLLGELFDSRQKGDYGNMVDFDEVFVDGLFEPVLELIDEVKKIL